MAAFLNLLPLTGTLTGGDKREGAGGGDFFRSLLVVLVPQGSGFAILHSPPGCYSAVPTMAEVDLPSTGLQRLGVAHRGDRKSLCPNAHVLLKRETILALRLDVCAAPCVGGEHAQFQSIQAQPVGSRGYVPVFALSGRGRRYQYAGCQSCANQEQGLRGPASRPSGSAAT